MQFKDITELINAENKAVALFSAVMTRQINLIVNWTSFFYSRRNEYG